MNSAKSWETYILPHFLSLLKKEIRLYFFFLRFIYFFSERAQVGGEERILSRLHTEHGARQGARSYDPEITI